MTHHRLSERYMSILLVALTMSGGCAAVPTCPPADNPLPLVQTPFPKPETASPMPPIAPSVSPETLALERKVKVQEKRIADLSSQLRMLKRIDLDRNKQ